MGKKFRVQRLKSDLDREVEDLFTKNSSETLEADIKPIYTYCPILESGCSTLDCETCPLIPEVYILHTWVCSMCVTEDMDIQPFWGDCSCSICGNDYGVKVLCTKKKRKRTNPRPVYRR